MEWINVKINLPDSHDVVLVSDGDNITVAQAYYNINNDFSWIMKINERDNWSEDGHEVTHWAVLPKAPNRMYE